MSADEDDAPESLHFIIPPELDEARLDKALVQLAQGFSRTRLQNLIDSGECMLGEAPCTTPSRRVAAGDIIKITLPPLEDADPQPENIPLDVLFEDDDVLVLNKPAGMVVHPAAGHASGTLVNALLYHCGDTLSGIGGVRRPGIVHRLDKDTSGLMMVAKNDKAHRALADQLQDRTLTRIYFALVMGVPTPVKGRVETLIGRHPSHRLKMAVLPRTGREAATNYLVHETRGEALSLVECRLETGRTHQIRVHMESIKHPLIGDPLYGPQPNALLSKLRKAGFEDDAIAHIQSFPRQALHAAAISFIHPKTDEEMDFEVPMPEDFQNLLDICFPE